MYTVKVVCDGNFVEASDIDSAIERVLSMFKKRLVGKSQPLASDSNMECIYEYKGLTHDELRILKRLLKTNGGSVSLKSIDSWVENDSKTRATRKGKKSKRSHSSTSSLVLSSKESSVCGDATGDTKRALITEARDVCSRINVLIDRLEHVLSPDTI